MRGLVIPDQKEDFEFRVMLAGGLALYLVGMLLAEHQRIEHSQ